MKHNYNVLTALMGLREGMKTALMYVYSYVLIGCVSHCVIYSSTMPPSNYLTPIGGGNIEMEENAAYGHVTSQSGQHVPPPDDSENVHVYDTI